MTTKVRPENHGVKQVWKVLANGQKRAYRYHRKTGKRVYAEFGTPDFDREVALCRGEVLPPIPRAFRHVYFIRAESTGLIKIGVADVVRSRFAALRAASPDKLTLLGSVKCMERGALEKRLHKQFADDRSHGEWFRPSPALLAFIADVQRQAA